MSTIDIPLEQMLEKPESGVLLEDWYDDRYVVYRNPEYKEITERYRSDNSFYDPAKHCICMDDSSTFGDFTGNCPCGRIRRELRPEKDFIRIRKKRFASYVSPKRKKLADDSSSEA